MRHRGVLAQEGKRGGLGLALGTPQLQTAQSWSVENMQILSWTKLGLAVTKK